jgi:hypothetical protein
MSETFEIIVFGFAHIALLATFIITLMILEDRENRKWK